MEKVRVRFAPSPTGALHIGGVRTALYNYLFARKNKGAFILRIEDTDQTRYVQGAEEYIMKSLSWLGIELDEGPGIGGDLGPYRQSDRKELYKNYTLKLIERGYAYYAFDTEAELESMRERKKQEGVHSPRYDASIRTSMRNSMTLSSEEVDDLLSKETPYVVRMKVPENEVVSFSDIIRGDIEFNTSELDDKVILKTDGMPTYHLANIVDDRLMEISHVIRGEEWLSSTAHHVLLYRGFGWEAEIPKFAHLPLILKPNGKGKLSKRAGDQLGIPIFPMSWSELGISGFDDFGFESNAIINFLAFLGWNPGTEQEIFSMDELIEAFSLDKIGKSGARFDFDKAKWFNQQYILAKDEDELIKIVRGIFEKERIQVSYDFIRKYTRLFRERVVLYNDFLSVGDYVYNEITDFDEKMIRKKWKQDSIDTYKQLGNLINNIEPFSANMIEEQVKSFMEKHDLGFGKIFPVLRLALSGTTRGADLFGTMELLGKKNCIDRWSYAMENFRNISSK